MIAAPPALEHFRLPWCAYANSAEFCKVRW